MNNNTDKFISPHLNEDDLSSLKNSFTAYLRANGRKEDRVKEDYNWAFTHYRNHIGIDFWDSLRSDAKIKECYNCYYNIAINGGFRGNGVKDPRGYAAGYMGSVKRLKEFFDHEYGGVDNYILKLNNQT